MQKYRSILMVAVFLTVGIGPVPEAAPAEGLPETLEQLQRFSDAFAEVAAGVQPCVVTIHSEVVVNAPGPMAGSPDDPFFHYFFGPQRPRGEQRRQGLGSGVIVSKDGYLLTNNHVIDGADRIHVELADGRSFEAQVVGADPRSDLAVLKIADRDLPAVRLGDSDRLRVGEWVLAVGNPFGLQHTVTYGIVSAVGRGSVGLADYEDFIQTDAAINPGNSGGALVNLRGELVGINTAIVSRSGGYQGIGFAIPVNMAEGIMKQLISHGRVRRGWLGVSVQDVTQEVAGALGLKAGNGVLVVAVEGNSPADRAGVARGDAVLEMDGQPVRSTYELRNRIAQTPPGADVRLKIYRDGRERTVAVKLGELEAPQPPSPAVSRREEALGWEVQELTGELARQLGYTEQGGALITNVQPGSVAYRTGLRPGDLIVEVNRRPVRTLDDYT